MSRTSIVTLALLLATAASASAAAPRAWPPAEGPGALFAHFGEEHWNDADGLRILPRVVTEVTRYKPALATMSGDKDSNGTTANLTRWKELMAPLDAAGIPYFAAVGNHDREKKPGFPDGIDPTGSIAPYKQVFADRPYPFGDGPPPTAPGFAIRARPADDPAGASTHYYLDYGNTRWIFIDNSCFSIVNCDALQNPPFPDADGDQGQFDFLRRVAADAAAAGKLAFVVMHMPTQDDRPGHTQPTPGAHTMGEGASPDNQMFEQVAAQVGIDGVFAGHIKGQWIYQAGGVPYYTDGGAGGALYVNQGGEVGVDTGYWYGFRLIRVNGGQVTTDTVPIFVPGSLTVRGPSEAKPGESVALTATGRQPAQDGPKVDALELRDPDRKRPNGAKLPTPARIWTTSNRFVAAPIAADRDDPRRDPATQTTSGRFSARCPGRATVTITSGFESAARTLIVRGRSGSVVRSVKRRRVSIVRRRSAPVAVVSLRQPAEVRVRVMRGRRTVRVLAHDCFPARRVTSRWAGVDSRGRRVRRGYYTVEVRISSDRRPVVRRWRVRVR